MSNYLNPGNGKFQESLDSNIYVDKTGLIGYTNGVLSTKHKYICVTRPRRFGKSYAAEMLVAYYSRGCDSRALFENLKIAQDPSFEKHLNRYDVVHINVAQVIKTDVDAETGIAELSADLMDDLREAYPDIFYEDESKIPSMLETVYEKTGTKFVFIIDEWDCPMRERKDDEESQKLYLQFLKDLFKDDEGYLALAYMTGILPIKKNSTGSGLNMFDEFSMTRPVGLKDCFGFTEEEVRAESAKRGVPFDDLKNWYDGYDVGGVSIYNPKSVENALKFRTLGSYWTNTEIYEDLKIHISENEFGIHDVILRLLLGETYPVNPDLFANDTVKRKCLEDTLTLLVHLGYLTYDSGNGTVRIPNLEIRREFIGTVKRMERSSISYVVSEAGKLFESIRNGEARSAEKSLDRICKKIKTTLDYETQAALSCAVQLACLSSTNAAYTIGLEVPAGDGVADFILTPVTGKDNIPIIIELKYNKSAQEAIDQIKDKRYADCFGGYAGDILLVGINCSGRTKKHCCMMERYRNA